MNDPLLEDLTRLQQLASLIDGQGPRLTAAMTFADDAARASRGATNAASMLKAMQRFESFETLVPAAPGPSTISRSPQAMAALIAGLNERHKAGVAGPAFDTAAAVGAGWAFWRDRLLAYLLNRTMGVGSVPRDQLLLASMGLAPARWFRQRLDQMTVAEWSEATLSVFRVDDEARVGPPWLLAAGLRALGAGEALVLAVLDQLVARPFPLLRFEPNDLSAAREFARGATGRTVSMSGASLATSPSGGVLMIIRDEGSATRAWRPDALALDRPLLAVRRSDYVDCRPAIAWLTEAGVIIGVTDEP